ncbi:MAG: alpha/beta hydrolase family protein, partial [Acidobacteriota bacterium]
EINDLMNLRMAKYCLVWAMCLAVSIIPIAGRSYAQSPGAPQEQKFASKLMAHDMPYRVILPNGYDDKVNATVKYPVIYLLHGLTGHYTNWADKTKLSDYASKHSFILVMPEGNDGWYTDSVSVPNDKYESYIVKELIPEIDGKFRTMANREHRVIAGLSMGGYGSLKFGLKYPDMFSLVGSFSGAIDAPLRGQTHTNYRPSIMAVFGADDSPLRKENDVFTIVSKISAERLKRLPFLYFACGTEDLVNFQLNRDFAGLLIEKKIPHEYRELPGAHTWEFWDDQVREFLDVAERRLKK